MSNFQKSVIGALAGLTFGLASLAFIFGSFTDKFGFSVGVSGFVLSVVGYYFCTQYARHYCLYCCWVCFRDIAPGERFVSVNGAGDIASVVCCDCLKRRVPPAERKLYREEPKQ